MTRRIVLFLLTALLLCAAGTALADYTYEGAAYPEDAEYIDLGDTVVKDFDGFADFLAQFPRLKQVDMWASRMAKSDCDRLAERFPDMRWGWTLLLKGKDHSHLIRTDQTSFSTLHNNKSSHHRSEDFEILKYCWHLYALDIGHNSVTDLSFLYSLPKLRVLIIACNEVEDITPIASLKDLEYAELFKNKISDLTPLSELPHIIDLNICFNKIKDWTPIYGLTTLKRLWLRENYKDPPQETQRPPKSVVNELKALMPDTVIDYTHWSTTGAWRQLNSKKLHPHYEAIIKTFGENHLKPSTTYYPFEDSYPFSEEDQAVLDAAHAAQ